MAGCAGSGKGSARSHGLRVGSSWMALKPEKSLRRQRLPGDSPLGGGEGAPGGGEEGRTEPGPEGHHGV